MKVSHQLKATRRMATILPELYLTSRQDHEEEHLEIGDSER